MEQYLIYIYIYNIFGIHSLSKIRMSHLTPERMLIEYKKRDWVTKLWSEYYFSTSCINWVLKGIIWAPKRKCSLFRSININDMSISVYIFTTDISGSLFFPLSPKSQVLQGWNSVLKLIRGLWLAQLQKH